MPPNIMKSVYIWLSYCHKKKGANFFETQCRCNCLSINHTLNAKDCLCISRLSHCGLFFWCSHYWFILFFNVWVGWVILSSLYSNVAPCYAISLLRNYFVLFLFQHDQHATKDWQIIPLARKHQPTDYFRTVDDVERKHSHFS